MNFPLLNSRTPRHPSKPQAQHPFFQRSIADLPQWVSVTFLCFPAQQPCPNYPPAQQCGKTVLYNPAPDCTPGFLGEPGHVGSTSSALCSRLCTAPGVSNPWFKSWIWHWLFHYFRQVTSLLRPPNFLSCRSVVGVGRKDDYGCPNEDTASPFSN